MSRKIAIAVGGSGGHTIPAMKIAQHLLDKCEVVFIGGGLEKNRFLNRNLARVVSIEAANFSKGLFQGSWKIFRGVKKALLFLKEEKVDHVIGLGSFHSLPVILAALIRGIPYSLFEPNTYPGKVNRFFSKWADVTWIYFSPAKNYLKGRVDLIDIDIDCSGLVINEDKKEALSHFGLEEGKKTLLVFGGSQGAKVINQRLAELAHAIKERYQVIHFTGRGLDIASVYKAHGVNCYVAEFSKEIEKAWVASDLVICRAGAGAIREMLIHEKPAIMIPYPHAADNHQWFNAEFMEKEVGGGVTLSEGDLTKERLKNLLGRDFKKEKEALKSFKKGHKEKTICEALGGLL